MGGNFQIPQGRNIQILLTSKPEKAVVNPVLPGKPLEGAFPVQVGLNEANLEFGTVVAKSRNSSLPVRRRMPDWRVGIATNPAERKLIRRCCRIRQVIYGSCICVIIVAAV